MQDELGSTYQYRKNDPHQHLFAQPRKLCICILYKTLNDVGERGSQQTRLLAE
jgi:hypothetical protein